jgi:pimeloyl-ACP methyl ester carboxylesterase
MTNVDLTIPSGDLTLRGTLVAPSPTPSPAALLISGSGPIDRDSNAKKLAINVMSQIATKLGEQGVASLRYDKRGAGQSDGDYYTAGLDDNIADAKAALTALRGRPEVDADNVVVIGHSEGALIAAAMADDDRLAGVVLLAGAADNGRDILKWQMGKVAATNPKPVRWLMKLLRQDLVATQVKRLNRIASSTDDVIRIQMVKVNAKWFRQFMTFEPLDALRRAATPVLAITGSKDIQVNPDDVAKMERAMMERDPTGRPSFTGHVVEDVTHLLRHDDGPPSVRTYKKQARRPLDTTVMTLMTEWIHDRTAAANGASAR